MKRRNYLMALFMLTIGTANASNFVTIKGENLMDANGKKLYIVGTNLGNWLNPEGYMFDFKKTNCEWMINDMVCELAGPDFAREFWQAFKDNYITEADIAYIKQTGANTIRLPFNYKLFTREDYMGKNDETEGFKQMDKVIDWCRKYDLHLILDMHDCPGGQTGDNIDNGHGYPWLFESESSQQLFCQIWQKIASRYKDEPVILGYELMNEPIATMFSDSLRAALNAKLEPLYKRATKAIREVDQNHIILLGGAQWNGNFEPFSDWKFDNKIMYTCHRYGGEPTKAAIQSIIDFRDKIKLPMYMGEIGHNTDQWQADFCATMKKANIGYTFWPYKKIDGSCMMGIKKPADWDSTIVKFAEADRSSFDAIRKARPDQEKGKKLLMQFVENAKKENCIPQKGYIKSMGLKAE
ncbi:glycoside hydrolase family 5 protein [Prevotella sp. AM34-19LB]|jgi:endoglucanase|nr:glycoside hydrolase family 5 protein [Prevotella sp. AM34-19LB]RHC76092.1 glycoside hydrolase family 5 protein [Prevotella sp. AM34-19LB]